MKQVADEDETIVRIPLIVRITVVFVEPTRAVIGIYVEQFRRPVYVMRVRRPYHRPSNSLGTEPNSTS